MKPQSDGTYKFDETKYVVVSERDIAQADEELTFGPEMVFCDSYRIFFHF